MQNPLLTALCVLAALAGSPNAGAAPKPTPKAPARSLSSPPTPPKAKAGGCALPAPGCKIPTNGVCFPASNPKAATDSLKCDGMSGTFVAKCPTENFVGCCTGIADSPDRYYYSVLDSYGGVTADEAKSACQTVKGKWTAK